MFFQIAQAASLLREGDVVAFPTETVYGLGASLFQPKAIERIFQVKKRPSDNPLIVHVSHLDQLESIVEEPPLLFFQLAEVFFPGPLTILLQKKECVSPLVSAGLPTIGVRMPAHPIAQALIEAVGVPLVAPSANLSGRPSSTTAQHVLDDFGTTIAGVIDGGPCTIGIESTVITLNPTPTILRPGAITRADLENVLQRPVLEAKDLTRRPLSPGMKYRHYAPKAKISLFYDHPSLDNYLKTNPIKKRLLLNDIKQHDLYSQLRKADLENYEEILILCDATTQKNHALMNRLLHASDKNAGVTPEK